MNHTGQLPYQIWPTFTTPGKHDVNVVACPLATPPGWCDVGVVETATPGIDPNVPPNYTLSTRTPQ
jgi:hypothetical protein